MEKTIKKNLIIYQKIQNMAANVGGILKVFSVVLALLTEIYNTNKLDYDLVKHISKYSSNKTTKKEKENDYSTINKPMKNNFLDSTPIKNVSNIKEISQRYNDLHKKLTELDDITLYLRRVNDLMEKNKSEICSEYSNTLFTYMKNIFFSKLLCKSDKAKVENDFIHQIRHSLDLKTIIDTNVRFNILCNTMFTQDEFKALFKIS